MGCPLDLAEHLIAHAALGISPLVVTLEDAISSGATATTQPIFNGGIDLGTSGRIDSNVADRAGAISCLVKPTVPLTADYLRSLFEVHNAAGSNFLSVHGDGHLQLWNGGATEGMFLVINGTGLSGDFLGIWFNPQFTGAGSALQGYSNSVAGAMFQGGDYSSATWTTGIGGVFTNSALAARAHSNLIGGVFQAMQSSAGASSSAHGNLYGFLVQSAGTTGKSSTATNAYGGYIQDALSGTLPATTNSYGLFIAKQTRGSTINSSLWIDSDGKIHFRDTALHIASLDDGHLDLTADTSIDLNANVDISAKNIITDTTTGTKIGTATNQKIGFYNATPVVQPSAIADATDYDEAITQLNLLLAAARTLGLVAAA